MSTDHAYHKPIIVDLTVSSTEAEDSSESCSILTTKESENLGLKCGDKHNNERTAAARKQVSSKLCSFRTSWREEYLFLEYDPQRNHMFCVPCRQYATPAQSNMPFVVGTSNFRTSSIRFHEQSVMHIQYSLRSSGQFEDEYQQRLAQVIRIVYLIIKDRRPYSTLMQVCEHHEELGLDLGEAYVSNVNTVPMFSKYIANEFMKTAAQALREVQTFALLLDSSMSRASEVHHLVYVKYFLEGGVKTDFVGVVNTSTGPKDLCQDLGVLLGKFGIGDWMKKVVYVYVDAWMNPPQWYPGLVETLNEESNDFICGINFLPHKLIPASCLNRGVTPVWMTRLHWFMYSVLDYYQSMPEEMRDLVHINKELEGLVLSDGKLPPQKSLVCFSFSVYEAFNADWASLVRTLKSFINYSVACNLDGKISRIGIKLKVLITRSQFLWSLALMLDNWKCLTDFTNKIQQPDFTPSSLPREAENFYHNLQRAKAGGGKYTDQFNKEFRDCRGSTLFRDTKVDFDYDLVELVGQTNNCLSDFAKQTSEDMSWLENEAITNISRWLSDEKHDDSEFANLYTRCFRKRSAEEIGDACSQWRDVRHYATSCFPAEEFDTPRSAISNMILVFRDDFPLAVSVLERLLLLDFSGGQLLADGFREMNLTKSSDRCRLTTDSLQYMMTIAMHGPEASGFDPRPVLKTWLEERSRRYRKRKAAQDME